MFQQCFGEAIEQPHRGPVWKLFVSVEFQAPRIGLQCWKVGLHGAATTDFGADFRGVSETMLLHYSSETLLKQVHSGNRIPENLFQDAE